MDEDTPYNQLSEWGYEHKTIILRTNNTVQDDSFCLERPLINFQQDEASCKR